MIKNDIELLCPAGDIDSFRVAIEAGADAIYMGISKYNAREMATNFDLDSYIECIRYAHLRGTKVYLTLNTLLFDNEIKDALEIAIKLYSHGLDAVIVQDLGLARFLHKLVPSLNLHASTQMSIYSLEQVNQMKKLGFKRVVLARELSIEEIKYICENTDIEIEVFVHGALCVSYSGQCLFSSFIGSRSANRGKCAQPCRMRYSLHKASEKEAIIKNKYLLSKKDIFGLNHIKRLRDIGVTSLKIEGRNKTPEYVSGVTSIYRKYIDKTCSIADDNDKNTLMQLFNRNGLSEGYLDGVKYKESITEISPKNTGLLLGEVLEQNKIYVKVKLEQDISIHDGIEIYSDDETVSNIVTCIKDETGKIVNDVCKKGQMVWLGDVKRKVKFGSNIYKTSDSILNEKLNTLYNKSKTNRVSEFELTVTIKENEEITALINNDEFSVSINIDYIPQIATKKSITKEDIIEAFSKTLDTPFRFSNISCNIDDGLFVPTSKLNELRRKAVETLESKFDINIDVDNILSNLDNFLGSMLSNISKEDSISTNTLYIYDYDTKVDYIQKCNAKFGSKPERIYINLIDIYKYGKDILSKYKNVEIFLAIPNVLGKKLNLYLKENIEDLIKLGINGVLLGNLGYIERLNELKEKYNIKIVADYSLNITNKYTCTALFNMGFDSFTLSFELSNNDILDISKRFNIEIVQDLATVMTSRYCILGSYITENKTSDKCSMPCVKDKYILKDSYGYNYYIVNDNIDCIMRLVKAIRNTDVKGRGISIRRCII